MATYMHACVSHLRYAVPSQRLHSGVQPLQVKSMPETRSADSGECGLLPAPVGITYTVGTVREPVDETHMYGSGRLRSGAMIAIQARAEPREGEGRSAVQE